MTMFLTFVLRLLIDCTAGWTMRFNVCAKHGKCLTARTRKAVRLLQLLDCCCYICSIIGYYGNQLLFQAPFGDQTTQLCAQVVSRVSFCVPDALQQAGTKAELCSDVMCRHSNVILSADGRPAISRQTDRFSSGQLTFDIVNCLLLLTHK